MFNLNNRAANSEILDAISSLDTRTLKHLPRSVRKQINRLPFQNDLPDLPRALNRKPRRRCLLIGLAIFSLIAVAAAAFFLIEDDDDFDFEIEL